VATVRERLADRPVGGGPISAVGRVLTSPSGFVLTLLVITSTGLGVDHFITSTRVQALLGLGNALLLVFLLIWFTPLQRAQTLCVVLVATCFEVIGSIVWGLYTYRLGNLPLFVPSGHGLVYLTGLRISQSRLAREHPQAFVRAVLAFALGWAVVGVSGVLGRVDAAGAFGVLVVSAAILWGRAPTVYAGVFLFVAFLEIYGTAVGTWRWAEHVPGLGVPDGNPPSGAASGYVVFDLFAVFLAPRAMSLLARLRARRAAAPPAVEGGALR
jgi:hypothetical protein